MEEYQRGTTQYLQVIVQDEDGAPVHGATVHATVYRDLDAFYLDSTSNTFVSSGGNSEILLTELGTSSLYRAPFDQTWDNGGVDRTYTVVYVISAPYGAMVLDTLSFYDKELEEIKGDGWNAASEKPDLMAIANKDNNDTFNPATDSLEAISDGGGGGGGSGGHGENYNSEGL